MATALPMPTACVSTMTSDVLRLRWPWDGRRKLVAVLVAGSVVLAAYGRGVSAADTAKEKSPACMHCGATCCLEAVCVCKQGKKKKPVTEYETKCEPICVARCSGPPWARRPAGCTECPPDQCRCPGWVRTRKTLVKETRDEEVDTLERSVGYVCATCAGRGPLSCCDAAPAKPSGWWQAWWPVFLR